MSFEVMYFKPLEFPSPIEDTTIYNFLIHSEDSQRWINNKSVTVLSGLKAIDRVNSYQRFDTPFWDQCMIEIKNIRHSKKNKTCCSYGGKKFFFLVNMRFKSGFKQN